MRAVGSRLVVVAMLGALVGGCTVDAVLGALVSPSSDRDGDGVSDVDDSCPDVLNADQADRDEDGRGDACDPERVMDRDRDDVPDEGDNCVSLANVDQSDLDEDGVGDLCDNCRRRPNADQLDADGNGIGDVCTCEACGPDQLCARHPGRAEVCVDTCPEDRSCGDECCPLGTECVDGACPLPDLWIDETYLAEGVYVDQRVFEEDSCALVEGCIVEGGSRKLLRFPLKTPNTGAGNLHLGAPADEELFEFSTCHEHYHFSTYAAYDLVDSADQIVAVGHKQAFCLMDYARGDGSRRPRYDCAFQGISAGWSDIYEGYLDCQWVDVTDVPPGEYQLRVRLNIEAELAESDYANNEVLVPVVLE